MGHVLEGATQLLDGNILLGDGVVGGTHDALRPRPYWLQVLISFEDGEACVPDLDGVEMRRFDCSHPQAVYATLVCTAAGEGQLGWDAPVLGAASFLTTIFWHTEAAGSFCVTFLFVFFS